MRSNTVISKSFSAFVITPESGVAFKYIEIVNTQSNERIATVFGNNTITQHKSNMGMAAYFELTELIKELFNYHLL